MPDNRRVEDIDLNLLRVFDAVMHAGTVTGAAEKLHLSVAATSRALGRLRHAMGDPILVRAGRGFVPTPFAERSVTRVRRILHETDLLRRDTGGEPRTWHRTFVIRINDALAPALIPRLQRSVQREAPGVRLRFEAQESKTAEALRDGSLDLDVGIVVHPAPDVLSETLFTDRFVAVVSEQSPLGRAAQVSIDDFCSVPHVSASRRGLARGPVDDVLEAGGRRREVTVVVPSYLVGALTVVGSDLACLLPRVLASHLRDEGMPLRLFDLPLDLPAAPVEQRWHRRVDDDDASRWLRSTLVRAVRDLVPGDAPIRGASAPDPSAAPPGTR